MASRGEGSFTEISPKEIADNPFVAIGKEWMLVTAGSLDRCNTMTASWGGLGVLWGRDIAICFVRPDRHTFGFIDQSSHFTLSFFADSFREALEYCGTHSGREGNKIERCGLEPMAVGQSVSFAEARLVILCKKIYAADFKPDRFTDSELETSIYKTAPHHRFFIGEIETVMRRT